MSVYQDNGRGPVVVFQVLIDLMFRPPLSPHGRGRGVSILWYRLQYTKKSIDLRICLGIGCMPSLTVVQLQEKSTL